MADDGFTDEILDDDDEEFDDEEIDAFEDGEDDEDDDDTPALQCAAVETKRTKNSVKLRPITWDYNEKSASELVETLVGGLRGAGFTKVAAVGILRDLKKTITEKSQLVAICYEVCALAKTHGVSAAAEAVKIGRLLFEGDAYEEARVAEDKEIAKLLTPLEVVEGIYVCPKCKSSRTQHYSVQLRRADEPPTVFIHCVNSNCKFKWREG